MSIASAYQARQSIARTGQASDEVCISKTQEAVHVTFEAIAVVAVAPFMLWLATRKELPDWARVTSGIVGVGTIVVDGGLLLSYWKKRKGQQ